MSFLNLLFFRFIFSGGGYLRFFPKNLIRTLYSLSKYNMVYVHPRDFDLDQPRLRDLSYLRYFRSYVGLATTKYKFKDCISADGISISEASNRISWDDVELYTRYVN